MQAVTCTQSNPARVAPGAGGSHADSSPAVQGRRDMRLLSRWLFFRDTPSSPGSLRCTPSQTTHHHQPSHRVLRVIQGPTCHLFHKALSNFQSGGDHSCHCLSNHLGLDGLSYLYPYLIPVTRLSGLELSLTQVVRKELLRIMFILSVPALGQGLSCVSFIQ